MGITQEQVEKAFDVVMEGKTLLEEEDAFLKSSEKDIDNPEGALMDEPKHSAGKKMSDLANDDGGSNSSTTTNDANKKLKKKSPKTEKGESEMDELNKGAFAQAALDNPEIEAKIEVSNFLKSLFDKVGDHMDSMADVFAKSVEQQGQYTASLEEQVADLQKSNAQMGIVLKAICENLRIIEDQPARQPKAETMSKAGYAERDFQAPQVDTVEQGNEPIFKGLNANPVIAKSQISQAMTDLVIKGEMKDVDLISFESGGFVSPEDSQKLQKFFAEQSGD